jgi:Pvc16 N-terminal domain
VVATSLAYALSTDEARTCHRRGTRDCPKGQTPSPLRLPVLALWAHRTKASLDLMIADVDASLRSLLRATALHGSNADVVFESPTRAWADKVAGEVVDAYLFEITEDVARTRGDWEDVRNEQGRVTGRRPPLHRYRLRYLLTAWGGTPAAEHRLLSKVLAALADEQAIPAQHVTGDLAEEGLPLFLSVALPSEGAAQPWDLWGALGVAPRPAIDVVVVAPLPRPAAHPAGPPVRDRRLTVAPLGGTPELVPTAIADERSRQARA